MFRQGSISRAWHRGSAFMGVGDLRLNFVSLLSDIFVEKGTSEDLKVLKEKKNTFLSILPILWGLLWQNNEGSSVFRTKQRLPI